MDEGSKLYTNYKTVIIYDTEPNVQMLMIEIQNKNKLAVLSKVVKYFSLCFRCVLI